MLGYAIIAVFLIVRGSSSGGTAKATWAAIVGAALTGLLAPHGLTPLLRWLAQWR